MEIVHHQMLTFTIADLSSSNTGTLSGFTSLSKMAVFATFSVEAITQETGSQEIFCDIDITNTTTLTAARVGTGDGRDVVVRAYVVEFGADTTVYKGEFSIADTDSDDLAVSIGGTVTLGETFGWSYHKAEGTTPNDDWAPSNTYVRMDFASTTTLDFNRGGSVGDIDGHFYVVESSTLTVNHYSHTNANTDVSITDTITTVNDLAETFLVGSFDTDQAQYNDEGTWDMDLQDASTVRFRRGFSDSSEESRFEYMVVEDTGIAVQRGTETNGADDTDTVALSPNVDLDLAIAKTSWGGGQGLHASTWYQEGLNARRCTQFYITAVNELTWLHDGVMQAPFYSWETVQFTEETGGSPARRVMVIS